MRGQLQPSSCLTSADGMAIPIIGLGTWQSTPEEIELTLRTAIEVGYRHIDTAFAYMNEKSIGDALKKIFDEGTVTRQQLFIVTKLPHIALRPQLVEPYLKKSLAALGVDYVDLYLIHNPVGFQNRGDDVFFPRDENGELELDMSTDHVALWKAMEAEVDAGRAKSIGVSNFNLRQVKRLVENCRLKPANNQVELHVYLQQPELVSFSKEFGITLTAYAPLGSPHLPVFNQIIKSKTKCERLFEPMKDPVIVQIAQNHGKTPAQILLRYLIEYGVAVIPKSTNPERIRQNFDIFDFELTSAEFAQISNLDRGEEGRMFAENNDFYVAMKRHPECPFEKGLYRGSRIPPNLRTFLNHSETLEFLLSLK